jgi:hypothetical protein
MYKIGILSTVTDENLRRRLRWSSATTGKFSGLRMALGTSYVFRIHIRNCPSRIDASEGLHSYFVGSPTPTQLQHISDDDLLSIATNSIEGGVGRVRAYR